MRIINRVVTTRETKDGIVTHVTEHILEDDRYHMMPMIQAAPELAGSNPSEIRVMCNICTQQFELDDQTVSRCPSCGSRDVSLV